LLYEESLAIAREAGDPRRIALALGGLGHVLFSLGDFERGMAVSREALALHRERGDTQAIAYGLGDLGHAARYQGRHEEAVALLGEALALIGELGDMRRSANMHAEMGHALRERGDYQQAVVSYREAVALHLELGMKSDFAPLLEGVALLACTHSQAVSAVRLCAAADRLRAAIGEALVLADRPCHDEALATTRRMLGDQAFAASWEAGQRLLPEQAATEALATLADTPAGTDTNDGTSPCTASHVCAR
jgi:tetratricopeptide (TPR) repeat protein